MSKFLLNLLVQNSKALVYSKIQFFIRKGISFNFRPNRPSGQPAYPAFLAPSSQAGRAGPPGHAPLPLSPSLTGIFRLKIKSGN
jgi:hypothetical protein